VSGPSDSRRSAAKLPPVLALRPYQQRWVDDRSRFKIAVKSARIGFSFATALEAVLDCLENPNASWTVLSASKAQSVEFVQEGVAKIKEAIGAVAEIYSEPFVDELGTTDVQVQKARFPNGARIQALPANPRTARGYPGNAILDEFAHHEDSYSIWAAITRQVALGHKLRVLSTPNGEQGKFYDLAREFGLESGVAPALNPKPAGPWSCHWVDAPMAIADGCPINLQEMRELIKDEDTVQQEFFCVFLKAMGAWLPQELVAMAEDAGATILFPPDYKPRGPLYGGIDVGRISDRSTLWLDEKIGDVLWARVVMKLHAMPFPQQHRELLPFVKRATRTAIDSTGMGIALYDSLNEDVGGRVMGVNFAGNNDHGVKLKTDLAIRLKKRFEKHLDRIPENKVDPQIRQELMAIKREATASGVTFDAPRIEVDTAIAGGKRKKIYSHADIFWAKALADFAADNGAISTEIHGSAQSMAHKQAEAYA
jgi:phage FluMu gp28-like protein